jgi:type IV pilus assembly protein PilQ
MSAFVWLDTIVTRARSARGACAWVFAVLALAMSGAAFAQAANSIDSMTVSKGASGRTIVKFTLKNAPANPPAGFAIATPPRIALDFLDTGNGLGTTQRAVDDVGLRSVNVIQAGNRTRVVFNLNRPQTFETQVEGNAVLVTLFDQSEQLDAKAQVVQKFAEARPGDVQHTLRDVDFRRGPAGEGRIVVELSDNATGIDIRQQGKALIVDFVKTSLPRNLERRLDVQDFGTPIVAVDTFTQGPNVRMIIEPKGLWEHAAYQTDNRFILEVKPIVEDPNKLVQGSRQGYKGEKLSLNFQNVEVRAVLQVIADFTGLNIITSDSVSGSLTLRLKDIPWDQALDIIMQTKGLDMRKNGNVVLIAPREELALKEKQQLESQNEISELEPLISESFQLNYIKASDLLNLITTNTQQKFGAGAGQTATTGGQGSIISKRGVALVDPRSNILFVQDTAARLEEVRKIIRQIDTPIRQVLIEARIVIASDKFGRQLGVRFGAQTGFRDRKSVV